jgi:hypothetical protein
MVFGKKVGPYFILLLSDQQTNKEGVMVRQAFAEIFRKDIAFCKNRVTYGFGVASGFWMG